MYKIGDKVETPQFTGIIEKVYESGVKVNGKMFPLKDIKPYRTAHEKLIEMGYRISQTTALQSSMYTIYEKEGSSITIIERKGGNTYKTRQEVTLDLSRILTQYLEELEGKE